jgi:hypothetical protein
MWTWTPLDGATVGPGYFDLDDGKAGAIAAEVGKAVSKWRDEDARHGLAKNEIDRMASPFEHQVLRWREQYQRAPAGQPAQDAAHDTEGRKNFRPTRV